MLLVAVVVIVAAAVGPFLKVPTIRQQTNYKDSSLSLTLRGRGRKRDACRGFYA